ncbi:MAG: exodeoxyribonuclease VII small subunit [Thermoplasmata archaeon]|nr:exodeoxyribonuclease VII small subunit [Thermoplasmata archaeon]MCK5413926.1 exodeoxyribonuclease VII small subunit [Thermoplasmata archaeon]
MEGDDNSGSPEGEEMSYEDSLERLEEIVQRLESGKLPLDESLQLFEEGTSLTKVCQRRLTEAELRIEKLMADGVRTEDIESSGLDD